MSFSKVHVDRRTKKSTFLSQINTLIDWQPIAKELTKVYKKGMKERGTKAYHPLVLFKMQLISVWYKLSDVGTEEHVLDSLTAMRFCGLELEDAVPDHSTLSRFRTELSEKKAYDRLLRKFNQQLKRHGLIVEGGSAKVDASLTDSPFSPKGKPQYEIAEDRQENNRNSEDVEKEKAQFKAQKIEQPGADNEARWVKKGGKYHFGYKKQMGTDERGMILGVHTTPANQHDSQGLAPLIDKIPKKQRQKVAADKGYKSKKNEAMLQQKGSKSQIMHKAYRNAPLTDWQKKYNRLISKTRWVVERTFGSLKRWFGSGVTRLKGLTKVHGLHVLESIAHNLKRSPGLVCQLAK